MKDEKRAGVSRIELAVGAASLFLFLVGVKRSFRREDGTEVLKDGQLVYGGAAAPGEVTVQPQT